METPTQVTKKNKNLHCIHFFISTIYSTKFSKQISVCIGTFFLLIMKYENRIKKNRNKRYTSFNVQILHYNLKYYTQSDHLKEHLMKLNKKELYIVFNIKSEYLPFVARCKIRKDILIIRIREKKKKTCSIGIYLQKTALSH